jgi:hypothetical protein
MRFALCALVAIACTKSPTSDPAPIGSATTTPSSVTTDALTVAGAAASPDARATETADTPVEAIADPVPVSGGRNPADDLNAQLGGSGAPATGGRSLVVVKSKRALDESSMNAGTMALEFVRKGQASVKTCFAALRAKDASARGVLTLRFAVDTTGAVRDASVEGFHPEAVSCVTSAMSSWTFHAPNKKTRYELVLDLVIG